MTIDLKRIRAIALDIAGVNAEHQRQEDYSDFIWTALNRNYQIFLYSSNSQEDLAEEDFEHPRLFFLRDQMPPSEALLETHPALIDAATLVISNHGGLQRWCEQNGLPYATLGEVEPLSPRGLRIARLTELAVLLDPTGFVLDDIVEIVREQVRFRSHRPLLVGIGGPPLSGVPQFTLDLRERLRTADFCLVELMDLTALMLTGDASTRPWVTAQAGRWLMEEVIAPLKSGQRVYVEKPPAELPADFGAHFPLFISEEAVVLMFSEQVFSPPVAEALDLSILLEVTAEETTRRVYEIPPEQDFDPKFTRQFLEHEGKMYWDYLRSNRVVERASIRVDANREQAFYLRESAPDGAPLA
jgi:hypothetical protein